MILTLQSRISININTFKPSLSFAKSVSQLQEVSVQCSWRKHLLNEKKCHANQCNSRDDFSSSCTYLSLGILMDIVLFFTTKPFWKREWGKDQYEYAGGKHLFHFVIHFPENIFWLFTVGFHLFYLNSLNSFLFTFPSFAAEQLTFITYIKIVC